jgi:hypothetical protein
MNFKGSQIYMPNGPFVKRWDIKMNTYLKISKERSKFVFG